MHNLTSLMLDIISLMLLDKDLSIWRIVPFENLTWAMLFLRLLQIVVRHKKNVQPATPSFYSHTQRVTPFPLASFIVSPSTSGFLKSRVTKISTILQFTFNGSFCPSARYDQTPQTLLMPQSQQFHYHTHVGHLTLKTAFINTKENAENYCSLIDEYFSDPSLIII